MRKRTYRAVSVKQIDVEQLVAGAETRLILGCDAAKEVWYGAWMNEQGEVLHIIESTNFTTRRRASTRMPSSPWAPARTFV